MLAHLRLGQTHGLGKISTGLMEVPKIWDVAYLPCGDGNSHTALGESQRTC